jgi:hypothetical protein
VQIDEKFRLVLPVRVADDGTPLLRLYHTPISREIFEANYRIIGATFSALMQPSARIGAPRIAALRLRDEGAADAREHGTVPADGGAVALLGEIKRLSCVLAPQGAQWTMVPVDAAIAQGIIDDEEWGEAESALVFFTCLYTMVTKKERGKMIGAVVSAIGGEITSLQPMEFAASLTM